MKWSQAAMGTAGLIIPLTVTIFIFAIIFAVSYV
jgi:hypothetical protein